MDRLAESSCNAYRRVVRDTPDFITYGYEPEFIGRLPVRVAFDRLLSDDLVQILTQAEDNILHKYIEDFKGYGIEAIFTILAIRDQVSPPTINIFNQDPACDLDYVANTAREMKIEYAISNSFGFGGTNGTLVFQKI